MDNDWKEQIQKNAQILEEMSEETRLMYEALGISREELLEFLYTKENFTDETWETLQDERDLLEKKIEEKLPQSPKNTKVTPSSIQGHWIYVK